MDVAVIGGGPAGLEFARCVVMLGGTVTLYEREDRLGGRLRDWCCLPGRSRVKMALEYWARIVETHERINVRLGCCIEDPATLLTAYSRVVIACGASEQLPVHALGITLPCNLTTHQALARLEWMKMRVVLVDGYRFGDPLGVALWICEHGGHVEVVTSFDQVGLGLDPTSRAARLDELAKYDVRFHTWVDIRSAANGMVIVFDHCRNRLWSLNDVDVVVWCLNPLPLRTVLAESSGVSRIGDARWPRGLEAATKDAHDLAYQMLVGEVGKESE